MSRTVFIQPPRDKCERKRTKSCGNALRIHTVTLADDDEVFGDEFIDPSREHARENLPTVGSRVATEKLLNTGDGKLLANDRIALRRAHHVTLQH